jgi:hypothetical protein
MLFEKNDDNNKLRLALILIDVNDDEFVEENNGL